MSQHRPPTPPADPLPEETGHKVAEITARLQQRLGTCRHRAAAELEMAAFLGVLEAGLLPGDPEPQRAALVAAVMMHVITDAAGHSGGPTLGLLRLAADLGPSVARESALEAALRLEGAGVPAPAWSGPAVLKVLRAWRSGDRGSGRHTVTAVFDYGGHEQALIGVIGDDLVLHQGFQDLRVGPADEADAARHRDRTRGRGHPLHWFEDIDELTLLTELRDALESRPCPETADEIENVGGHLHLARLRAEQIATARGRPPVELYADNILEDLVRLAATGDDVLRVRVELTGTEPVVWRRLDLPGRAPLLDLNRMLLAAFEWEDGRCGTFEGTRSGRLPYTRVSSLITRPGDRIHCSYGIFGEWRIRVELEAVTPPEPGVRYPRCVGGGRASPPEELDGAPGLQRVLAALAAPDRAGSEADLVQALDLAFLAPERFSPSAVNRRLDRESRR